MMKTIRFTVHVFIISAAFAIGLQLMTPELLSSYDPLYHIAHARAIAAGETMDLPQLSTLTGMTAGPWIAYQLMLSPFVGLAADPVAMIVAAQVGHGVVVGIMAAVLFLVIRYAVTAVTALSAHQANWMAVGALVLMPILSFGFLARMLMLRPQAIAVAVTFVSIYCIVRRYWRWLFAVAVIYPFMYSAVFLLLIPALVHAGVAYMRNRLNTTQYVPAYLAPAVVTGGLVLGALLRPETGQYVYNAIFVHLASIANRFAFFAGGASPQELVSADASAIIMWLALVLFLIVLVPLIAVARGHSITALMSEAHLFLLGLSSAYLLMVLFFSRAIEYLVPVWVLTAVVLIASAAPFSQSQKRLQAWLFDRYPGIARDLRALYTGVVQRRHFLKSAAAGAVLLSILIVATRVGGILLFAEGGVSVYQKQAAAATLAEKAAGETVFHVQWSDYPHLTYFNPNSTYLMGMDSMFTYFYDRERYWLWYHIARGAPRTTCASYSCSERTRDTHTVLREVFEASYVYVSNPNSSLDDVPGYMWAFDDSTDFTRVYSYSDANAIPRIRIYKIEPNEQSGR
jgi:hypothetical protein